MKNLSRRGFLSSTTKAALTGAVASQILSPNRAFAQSVEPEAETMEGLVLESEISINHGHALELTVPQLVTSLRQAQVDQANAVISIQGQSHPHNVELSSDEMVALILGEELTKASVGGNHSHDVLIRLNVN